MSCGDSEECRRATGAAATAASALTGGTIGALLVPKHSAVGAIGGAMVSGALIGWFFSSYWGQPERPAELPVRFP